MKLFFAYDHPQSGTESVLRAVAASLRTMGHVVDEMATGIEGKHVPKGFDVTLKGYDAAHFWNPRASWAFIGDGISVPWGITSHGFGGVGNVQQVTQARYIDFFKISDADWFHTMDVFTLNLLGREGIYSFYTPQVITREGFHRLPPPSTITLGCVGANDDGYKRFEVIEAAARMIGIQAVLHDSSATLLDKDGVIDFYRRVGVYVNACFGACGPVPAQEALLCGRPVITTHLQTMMDVVQAGVNGEFFNGSAEHLAKKVERVLADYMHYYDGTLTTKLNSPDEAARLFIEGIEDAL